MLRDFITKNRSYRRFNETTAITRDKLESLIALTRFCSSARNQQALKYLLVSQKEKCELLFPTLGWAGYLADWDGPVAGERPTGYIIILGDTRLGSKFDIDLGICAQTILLGAVELGLGGCMIGSIHRESVSQLFAIPAYLEILLVLALGEPVEEVVIDPVKDGNIRYWRDENLVHHVPKRSVDELLFM